ncbi:MAG: bifunctional DNA-formamidopyrimidine glycosylase/DNA-(apurinic or apyrimidinic site) lyase [Candidatus Schekmanbacteria bacterium]|nr:bifunctional DNA-formamidopyrimidine glycosylase/DNA-(apurinic or apyrimidinic site) lyase [Candidatus Schekmanbacteria bacterium]
MPELPEVESIVRGLRPNICGKVIWQIEILDSRLLPNITPPDLQNKVTGRTIGQLQRRGKFILFVLANKSCLLAHLRMTGKYLYFPAQKSAGRYTRMIISFSDGSQLHYEDLRRFGQLSFHASQSDIPSLADLGPEPFSAEYSVSYLQKKFASGKRPVKVLLLDQRIIAGIGNIYACEILYRAGISPYRPTNLISKQETERLVAATREILEKAIQCQGTTISDYVMSNGDTGSFQECLNVYERGGESCNVCSTPVKRVKQAQRSTYFCPTCQK